MVYGSATPTITAVLCAVCESAVESGAKYCGNCGAVANQPDVQTNNRSAVELPKPAVPNFVPVAPRPVPAAVAHLNEEESKLTVLLVRERLFLYMHWLIFLSANIFGLWLTLKCYHEYMADEMTRIMMACTPLMYINLLALVCLVPIKGTRRSIAGLKEKLNYVKFQREYNHLL